MSDIPQQQHIETLSYSTPPQGRPGILTAVGVMSIVVGGLGMLQNGASVVSMGMFFFMSNRMTTMGSNRFAILLNGGQACLSALLGTYLLVCGILALLNWRQARQLHVIYAWIKLPMAIVGALTYMYWMTSLSGGRGPSMPALFLVMASGQALIALAYPVAVLIVMNIKTVRAYYAARTT